MCDTHTYRRPKKLVLLSEVTDAGLGTLSFPKESCDLQEILLTLHSIATECNIRLMFLILSGNNLQFYHTGQTGGIVKCVVFFPLTPTSGE